MNNFSIALTCAWFVVLSVFVVTNPEWVGQWQAKAEYAFILEAERLGLWGE